MHLCRAIAILSTATAFLTGNAAALSVTTTGRAPLECEAPAGSGLEAIFVVWSSAGAILSYPDADAIWSRFGSAGGGTAERIEAERGPETSSVTLTGGDTGVIVESGGRQHCFWICDYSVRPLSLQGLEVAANDCDRILLRLTGSAEPIYYYSVTGRRLELSRQLELSYSQQVPDEESFSFRVLTATDELESAPEGEIQLLSPLLAATSFTLTGDRFLRSWGEAATVESDLTPPGGVAVMAKSSEIGETLSAPYEVSFEAAVSEGVVHEEWQIADNEDFAEVTHRFYTPELNFTFHDAGTHFVKFIGTDAAGQCSAESDVFTIGISESELSCPNTLVLREGQTRKWRVKAKSLEQFKCAIFDRYGAKIYTSNDPAEGWDGTRAGRKVATGVYYYVIEARGSDGRTYKKSGDINVLKERILR